MRYRSSPFGHCSTAIRIMIIARARKNRADDTKARNQRQIITLYLLTESILAHCRYVTTEKLSKLKQIFIIPTYQGVWRSRPYPLWKDYTQTRSIGELDTILQEEKAFKLLV